MASIGDVSFAIKATDQASAALKAVGESLKQAASQAGAAQSGLGGFDTAAKAAGEAAAALSSSLAALRAALSGEAGDAAKAAGAMDAAAGSARAFGQAAAQSSTAVESHRSALARLQSLLVSGLGYSVAYQALGQFEQLLGDAGGAIFGFNGQLEQVQIGFTQLLGSGQAATKMLSELKDFAATTPFQLPGLIQAAQQLLGAGTAAEDIIPLMTDVGNAVSASGAATTEQIGRVVTAITQIHNSVHLNAQDMNQLVQAQIPAWKILADALGVTQAQARELAEQGAITGDVFIEAFDKFAKAHYGDMMEKNSQTFLGAISNIQDGLRNLLSASFEPLFEKVRDLTVVFGNWLTSNDAKVWAANFQQDVQQVIGVLQELWPVVQQVGGAIQSLFGSADTSKASMIDIKPIGGAPGNAGYDLQADENRPLSGAGAVAATQATKQYTDQLAEAAKQQKSIGLQIEQNSAATKDNQTAQRNIQASYDAQLRPLQDALDLQKQQIAVEQAKAQLEQGRIQASYQAQIQPLQDALDKQTLQLDNEQKLAQVAQDQTKAGFEARLQPLQDAYTQQQQSLQIEQEQAQFNLDTGKAAWEARLKPLQDSIAAQQQLLDLAQQTNEAQQASIQDAYAPQIEQAQYALTLANEGIDDQQKQAQIQQDSIQNYWVPLIQAAQDQLNALEAANAAAQKQAQIQEDMVHAAYDPQIAALNAQVTAINDQVKAAQSLLDLDQQRATIALEQATLAAAGDPQQRAAIAAQLERNKLAEDALTNAQQQLQLQQQLDALNNSTASAANAFGTVTLTSGTLGGPDPEQQRQLLQLQLGDLKLQAQQQSLINTDLSAQVASMQVLNQAQQDSNKLTADKASLQAQLDTAPLIARVQALTDKEQAALAPLDARLTSLKLQDDSYEGLREHVAALQAQEQATLEPVEARLRDIQAQRDALYPQEAVLANLQAQEAARLEPLKQAALAIKAQTDGLNGSKLALAALLIQEGQALAPAQQRLDLINGQLLALVPQDIAIKQIQQSEAAALVPGQRRLDQINLQRDGLAQQQITLAGLQLAERLALEPAQDRLTALQQQSLALAPQEAAITAIKTAEEQALRPLQDQALALQNIGDQLDQQKTKWDAVAKSAQDALDALNGASKAPPPPTGPSFAPDIAVPPGTGGVPPATAGALNNKGLVDTLKAIGSQFDYLGQTIREDQDRIGGFFSAIGTTLHQAGINFSELGSEVHDALSPLGPLFDALGKAGGIAFGSLGDDLSKLGGFFHQATLDYGGFFGALGSEMQREQGQYGAFFSALGSAAQAGLKAVGGAFDTLGTGIKGDLDNAGKNFRDFRDLLGTGVAGAKGLLGDIGSGLGQVLSALGTWAQGVLNTVTGTASNAWVGFRDLLGNATSGVFGALTGALGTLGKTAGTWAQGIASAIGEKAGGLGDAFSGFGTHLNTLLTVDVPGFLVTAFTSAQTNLTTGIGGVLSALGNAFSQLFGPSGQIAAAFAYFWGKGGPVDTLVSNVGLAFQGLAKGIEDALAGISTWIAQHDPFAGLVQKAKDAAGAVGGFFSGLGTSVHAALPGGGPSAPTPQAQTGASLWSSQSGQPQSAFQGQGQGVVDLFNAQAAANNKAAGVGGGLGEMSQQSPAAINNFGTQMAQAMVGITSGYAGLCETAVEVAYGQATGLGKPWWGGSAYEAYNNLVAQGWLHGTGTPPVGALPYFNWVDPMDGINKGHVGVMEPGGQFRSALDNGVITESIQTYLDQNPTASYRGWVMPPAPVVQAQNPYLGGGLITEPVLGIGLNSGQRYSFAEDGRPERVLSARQTAERDAGRHTHYHLTISGGSVRDGLTERDLERMFSRMALLNGG